MVKTYDEKSYELARHFLDDYALGAAFKEDAAKRLALLVQETVENFLQDENING